MVLPILHRLALIINAKTRMIAAIEHIAIINERNNIALPSMGSVVDVVVSDVVVPVVVVVVVVVVLMLMTV